MPALQLSPVATGSHTQLARLGPSHRRCRAVAFTSATRSQSGFPCLCTPVPEGMPTQPAETAQPHALRAALVLAAAAVTMASAPSALARMELPNKEVDDATSPFVQKLLKRSEENRERYQKERLQDYYRRNFKEYFEFEASSAKVARARGLSTESQEAIAKWLEENK
ncbi:hypothetical protein PLESTM_000482700 [Pleodorina starrii]|nr:hypothetical protein PLESTM_000482700 [Pleodorina starrii]